MAGCSLLDKELL